MSESPEQRDCPSAESLAAWVEGRSETGTGTAVEEHVATCGTCGDVVAAVLPAEDGSIAPPASRPESLPTRRRRPGRWAIAATLAVITGALAYGAVGVVVDRARVELARRAGDALGQPVAIGRLHVALTRGFDVLEIRLGNVRIGEPAATTVEDIAVRFPLASLVAGAPVVSALRLVGPVIHLGDASSIARPGHGGGRHNAVAAAMGTAPLEIVEGTLLIDAPETRTLAIEHLVGTTTPGDGALHISLHASSAGGPMSAEGAIPLDNDGPLSITIVGQHLALAALPYADGRLSGTADLDARVTGTVHDPVLSARALVRDGRAVGWNPLPSLLSGFATGGAGTPSSSGSRDDLRFEELRVAVVSGPHGWRVPRFYASGVGLVVGGSLEIDAERALHGTGSVRLPASTADALVAARASLGALRDHDGSLTLPITIVGTLDAPRTTLADEHTAPPPAAPDAGQTDPGT